MLDIFNNPLSFTPPPLPLIRGSSSIATPLRLLPPPSEAEKKTGRGFIRTFTVKDEKTCSLNNIYYGLISYSILGLISFCNFLMTTTTTVLFLPAVNDNVRLCLCLPELNRVAGVTLFRHQKIFIGMSIRQYYIVTARWMMPIIV